MHCFMYVSTANSIAHSELLHWQEVVTQEEFYSLRDESGAMAYHAVVEFSLSPNAAQQGVSINAEDIHCICVQFSVYKVLSQVWFLLNHQDIAILGQGRRPSQDSSDLLALKTQVAMMSTQWQLMSFGQFVSCKFVCCQWHNLELHVPQAEATARNASG